MIDFRNPNSAENLAVDRRLEELEDAVHEAARRAIYDDRGDQFMDPFIVADALQEIAEEVAGW